MKIQKYFTLFAGLLILTFVSTAFVNETERVAKLDTIALTIDEMDDGQEIYMTRCLSCHMGEGEGVPGVFPPLTESEYVTEDKGRLVRMILNGLSGEIKVNDVTYSGMMPPWGGFLNDQQVADVLTYIRSSFGNEADAVTAEEVAKIRAKDGDRKDTWTIEELNKPENQGILGGD